MNLASISTSVRFFNLLSVFGDAAAASAAAFFGSACLAAALSPFLGLSFSDNP